VTSRSATHLSPRAVVPAALVASLAIGLLMARNPILGIGAAVALLALPLALLDLRIALVGTLLLGFLEPSGLLGKIPYLASLLLVAVWAGTFRARAAHLRELAHRHRGLLVALVALAVWLALTIAWAAVPHDANKATRQWVASMMLMVITASTPRTPRTARLLAVSFVVGALVSLAVGLADNGLQASQNAFESSASTRLSGGAGDPNYLAAGLVPAMALAGALAAGTAGALRRFGAVLAVAALAAGLAATQSRGGLIALGVALVVGMALARGRRAHVLGIALAVVAAASAFFAVSPAALDRLTNFDGGGTGRTELWTVGWRMVQQRPLLGVGLDNFQDRAGDFVRQPGSLQFVRLIVDQPHVTHNVYLQQWAETGIVGLVLLLVIPAGAVSAALAAGRRFERQGETAMAVLARALVAAQASMLAASFFISNGTDKRMWFLLGLGPGLLAVAHRRDAS
jgi:O-antigen ligase